MRIDLVNLAQRGEQDPAHGSTLVLLKVHKENERNKIKILLLLSTAYDIISI